MFDPLLVSYYLLQVLQVGGRGGKRRGRRGGEGRGGKGYVVNVEAMSMLTRPQHAVWEGDMCWVRGLTDMQLCMYVCM